jgi:lipoate---protein ligase
MNIFENLSLSAEENLALDEILLMKAESGQAGESLRFWDVDSYFVVIGRSGKAEEECFLSKCEEDGVKVLRRISGGGTVLQGPGCLNYSAVLAYSFDERYRRTGFSYESIMNGLSSEFRKKGIKSEFMPISDLAVEGRKFSGNAQARKKKFFLHHGTILYGMDLGMIGRYLKYPPKEPEYRIGRAHGDFITNIQLSPEDIMDVIKGFFLPGRKQGFPAKEAPDVMRELVFQKYSLDSWNFCF